MKPFKHIDARTINGAIKLKSKGKTKLIAGRGQTFSGY